MQRYWETGLRTTKGRESKRTPHSKELGPKELHTQIMDKPETNLIFPHTHTLGKSQESS